MKQNNEVLFADNSNILGSACPVCDKSVDSHGRQIVDEESSTRRVFLCCLDSWLVLKIVYTQYGL